MTTTKKCLAKIRPLSDDTELQCEEPHLYGQKHSATLRDYVYPGSATKISWLDDDRRTFRGDWVECPKRNCILPANHRGNHAE